MPADPAVAAVLTALAAGDWERAAETAAGIAVVEQATPLARALDEFLRSQREPGVYAEPTAFESFVDHGTNPELYRRAIELVRAVHATTRPAAVLDLGCGDGRVVSAVLDHATTRVDLVEPSRPLLADAVTAVARPGLDVVAHGLGAMEFTARVDPSRRWNLAEATFALSAIEPAERPALFGWLASRVDRLLVIEFDVPALADGSPEQVARLAEHYEAGVAEYREHPEAVSGFLMPVLVGQLDPGQPRYTFEQPIDAWRDQLHAAGFTTTTTPVFDYWWAPAVLIDGRPAG